MKAKLRKILLALAVTATAILAAPAMATPVIGQPVDGDGNPIYEGDVEWVDFFIPLNDSEEFDGSNTRDYCNSNGAGAGNCGGGVLGLRLYFDIDWTGSTTLTIDFDDLDAPGYGDSNYFTEFLGMEIYLTEGGDPIILTAEWITAQLTGDSGSQQLVLDLDIEGDFYIHMIFSTEFDDELTPDGYFRNTSESLRAEAVSVPEPGTLALLGIGLLFIAFTRPRRTVEVKH